MSRLIIGVTRHNYHQLNSFFCRLTRFGGCILASILAASGFSQETFISFLVARKQSQESLPVLTIYGYPGSTNQIQYADSLSSASQWNVLTNVVLTNSSFSMVAPEAAKAGARFYRAMVLGGSAITVSTNLVWIPPGQFLMGSPTTEQDRNFDEGPQT